MPHHYCHYFFSICHSLACCLLVLPYHMVNKDEYITDNTSGGLTVRCRKPSSLAFVCLSICLSQSQELYLGAKAMSSLPEMSLWRRKNKLNCGSHSHVVPDRGIFFEGFFNTPRRVISPKCLLKNLLDLRENFVFGQESHHYGSYSCPDLDYTDTYTVSAPHSPRRSSALSDCYCFTSTSISDGPRRFVP